MKIALIPARGGSKRIPRKNIRVFAGKPMITWPIQVALGSGCFDRVVVSTDDAEIAQVALDAGAEVPFMRPHELADDHAGTIAVIRHAISQLIPDPGADDAVCCILATAPFIRAEDLQRGWRDLELTKSQFALSVAAYRAPIQRAIRLDSQHRVSMFDASQFHRRSQDLEPAYHDAGQFCWGLARAWQCTENVFTPECVAIELPAHRVQDIDTPDDWQRAEWMFRAQSVDAGR